MNPAHLCFEPELVQRAQPVQLLLLDVDGVLTDGGLYYGPQGEVMKRFHVLDGHGMKLLAQEGVQIVIISGRSGEATQTRLDGLGIQRERQFLGVHDKLQVAQSYLQQHQFSWSQTAAVGDDWPDLGLLRHAALAIAPANAHDEAKAVAHYVCRRSGGDGAVREACDLLLQARGAYPRLLESPKC